MQNDCGNDAVIESDDGYRGFAAYTRVFDERGRVSDGGQVKAGEPLYALESDKSIQEIEVPASGTLKVVAQLGATYTVGAVLAVIL